MNNEESSVFDAKVDLKQVEPIKQKRTLAFFNHWVLHTVSFLNKFSSICQQRLNAIDDKLQHASDSLAILEAKLASISDLEDISVPQASTQLPLPASPHDQPVAEVEGEVRQLEPEHDNNPEQVTPVSKHPKYMGYFKMVAVGVPIPAVKIKMVSEGLDPSILDDPNAPAPPIAAETTTYEPDPDEVSWSD